MVMTTMRELLRLILTTGLSNRRIGQLNSVSHNTVQRYRQLLSRLELTWPVINAMDDPAIEQLLGNGSKRLSNKRMPDWAEVHKQMQQPGTILVALWEDYRLPSPSDAYSYSQFTEHYRQYTGKLDLTMRQSYRAGEYVFVDFAGHTVPWFDAAMGGEQRAQIFVACLGCSNYTFACALRSQSMPDWIDAHNRMFAFFGGVPQIVVPDNLKAAVIHPGREPELNRSYLEMAKHYGIVIVPTRVRRPQDKAKVEAAVLFVERWILARLRHFRFTSLEDINEAIAQLLKRLNERPFKRLPGCRRARFLELDQPLLKPLPESSFEYAEWTGPIKVGPDYHALIRNHHYSVPYTLAHEVVEARLTGKTVEIFRQGRRIASHLRSFAAGGHSTQAIHQTAKHRYHAEQTPERVFEWAKTVGPATTNAVHHQFSRSPYQLPALNACVGLQRLAKDYGPERLEAACRRADDIGSLTLKSIRSILQRRLDTQGCLQLPPAPHCASHDNVRGSAYYSGGTRHVD